MLDSEHRLGGWRARIVFLILIVGAGQPALTAETVALESCHLPRIPTPALCGSLTVPENRQTGEGRTIDLRIAVLPALEQPPRPDPLFILAGGPGQSAVAIAALIKSNLGRVNQFRDIVFVDQRGTGQSNPLNCDFDLDDLAFDTESKAVAVRSCLDEIDADPRHYTTVNHIEDLEAVRSALGYQRINLYGGSYGTRVAQVYLREHPDSLRTVVMDAVASMDMRVGLEMGADAQLALDALFERCLAEPGCNEQFPDLSRQFGDLLADLEANPRELEFPNPTTGVIESTPMDHRSFALAIRGLLYAPTIQRLIPLVIQESSKNNWAPLLGLAYSSSESLLEVMTPGLLFAVLCTEDLSNIGPGDIPEREHQSFVGTTQIDEFLGFCAAWPEPLSDTDWSAPQTDKPVLLLSGSLDPATPPFRAEDAARTLSNHRHVEVPTGGHTVGGMGCVPRLIAEFLESADPAALDSECVDEIPAPSFFVTSMGPQP